MRKLLSSLIILIALFPLYVEAEAVRDNVDRQVPVMLINDVYRLDNLPGVRALRQQLESQYGNFLLLHAPDR